MLESLDSVPTVTTRIDRHTEMLQSDVYRRTLLARFAPTLCYHSAEQNFPMHPDEFIESVVIAKYRFYQEKRGSGGLSLVNEAHPDRASEYDEYEFLRDHFFDEEGNFVQNYPRDPTQDRAFRSALTDDERYKDLFIFDEKKYGFRDGQTIPVLGGVYPQGHPKKPTQVASNRHGNAEDVPIQCSIIATHAGFFIRYDSTYSLNNAIPGLGWIRKITPWWLANKMSHLGFHYGDIEGVGFYVNVDPDTKEATIESMQTFAHGRDGARRVPIADCTIRDSRVCVFVGLGGHPAYADNFVGRSQFLDKVGDTWQITPSARAIVDCSPDKLVADDPAIPISWRKLPRLADSNNMIMTAGSTSPHTQAQLTQEEREWHRYEPYLLLTRAYHWIKDFIVHIFSPRAENMAANTVEAVHFSDTGENTRADTTPRHSGKEPAGPDVDLGAAEVTPDEGPRYKETPL